VKHAFHDFTGNPVLGGEKILVNSRNFAVALPKKGWIMGFSIWNPAPVLYAERDGFSITLFQ
jgi:hypothetical protein